MPPPQASGTRAVQPMAPNPAQRMTSIAKGPLVPQLMVPQLAVPPGSSSSTPNAMHAPRGYVPRSYVAAAPQTSSLPAPGQLQVQAQAAVKTIMPAREMMPAPKREGSPQSSIETVETVATEKEMIAEKQAGVGLEEPAVTTQRAAPSTIMQVQAESPDDTVFVAPLASKEDEKEACTCCDAPVAETQVAVEEEVKTLIAGKHFYVHMTTGAAKTAAVEVEAASLAVQPKQQAGCFDAILAILPCGKGQ